MEHQHQHTRQRGTVFLQSTPAVFDLFRALYPVRFARALSDSVDRAAVFSNDCAYLSECAARGEREEDVKSKLVEAGERLEVLGTSWFEDSLVSYCSIFVLGDPDLTGCTDGRGSTCRNVRSSLCWRPWEKLRVSWRRAIRTDLMSAKGQLQVRWARFEGSQSSGR